MNIITETLYPFIQKGASVSIDSRNIDKNTIFFALKGHSLDGNDFALQAIEKGALCAVVDNRNISGERIYHTEDTLETLQQLARYHRNHLKIPFIGITGSNGKTTTKELISAVLSKKYKALSTQGNYNNHIGVPLTLLSIRQWHEIAVIEMGANHMGEIDFLSHIAMPDSGIITNVGKAHIEGFGSEENVVIAKTELYRYLEKKHGVVFINQENKKLKENCHVALRIGYGSQSDYAGRIISSSPFLKIAVWQKTSDQEIEIQTRLIGDYNFENILAAAAIGSYYGVAWQEIKNAIEEYQPNNNRSQYKNTGKNQLVMDAYNANPSSMAAAIDNFSALQNPEKSYILGDMLELGHTSEAEHKQIVDMLLMQDFSFAVLVGQEFCSIDVSHPRIFQFKHFSQASQWLSENPAIGQTILVKGSRGIQLEKLEPYL
jgi:UDP-N-acetylmuramoyl-tripeptide--D-alanyl-D-alanine ligase